MKKDDGREKMIEREVEKTIRCLDDVKAIKSSTGFIDRLEARLEDIKSRHSVWSGVVLPKIGLRLAFLILIVAANVYSASVVLRNGSVEATDRQTIIERIATEYDLIEENLVQYPVAR